VTAQGASVAFQIGHSVATATQMGITAAVSIAGNTVTVDYGCTPPLPGMN